MEAKTPSPSPPIFRDILQLLAEKRDLSQDQAAFAIEQIADGTAGETEAAAFLMGLRVKGETAEEIAGLTQVMRRLAVKVESPHAQVLVDVVGTGGDNLGTFNISTTTALVAAGAGAKIAKHGNRAASSRCGSADVLEALGVRVDLEPREIASCIDRVGIGFMLASRHHPASGRVARVRRTLGVRTVFNLLGPLTNPAGAQRQLMGVSAPEYLEVLAGAFARTGCKRAILVHGRDGMDELSVTGPSVVLEVEDGRVGTPYVLDPEEYGLPRYELGDLAGGDAQENARITRQVLSGRRGGPRDAVVLNAAAALKTAGMTTSIEEGLERARASIDSGSAARVLEGLVALTNAFAEERK